MGGWVARTRVVCMCVRMLHARARQAAVQARLVTTCRRSVPRPDPCRPAPRPAAHARTPAFLELLAQPAQVVRACLGREQLLALGTPRTVLLLSGVWHHHAREPGTRGLTGHDGPAWARSCPSRTNALPPGCAHRAVSDDPRAQGCSQAHAWRAQALGVHQRRPQHAGPHGRPHAEGRPGTNLQDCGREKVAADHLQHQRYTCTGAPAVRHPPAGPPARGRGAGGTPFSVCGSSFRTTPKSEGWLRDDRFVDMATRTEHAPRKAPPRRTPGVPSKSPSPPPSLGLSSVFEPRGMVRAPFRNTLFRIKKQKEKQKRHHVLCRQVA